MILSAIAGHLDAENIAELGTDLFVGFQPDTPAAVLALYNVAAPMQPYMSEVNTDAAGVQLLARSDSYPAARLMLLTAYKALAGYRGEMGEESILNTIILTAPAHIGRDERGRHEFSATLGFTYKSTGNLHRTEIN